jgi:hypothetical protein
MKAKDIGTIHASSTNATEAQKSWVPMIATKDAARRLLVGADVPPNGFSRSPTGRRRRRNLAHVLLGFVAAR